VIILAKKPKRRRRSNPRLAKINRNYTVEEVATLFGIHRNTVRLWVKQGLPTSDDRRPTLILGRDLRAFLDERRSKCRRTCKPGEMYCLRCREPRAPAGAMADYEPITETLGNLVAICSNCEALMNRRVNLTKLDDVSGNVEITMPLALRRISESARPCLKGDFT
jgi:hypothetical protein